jgi:allantoicase
VTDFDASFEALPDLASRAVGGGVVAANDEFFADKENLVTPAPPVFSPHTFTHKGQLYDGWETRRRREPGHDWAIVRLGLAGVIRGAVVDTAFFTGNFPAECSVEGLAADGYPSPAELAAASWEPLVARTALTGDAQHPFAVTSPRRFTHVRLAIYPDGGVARLRVHGEPVADPRLLDCGPVDLAALANGAHIAACSNAFYSTPANLISPGEARVMGDGWETARRRGDGNEWVSVALAAAGVVRIAELDTTHFKGNAPGWAELRGRTGDDWFPLLPRTRLQPDTRHRFLLADPAAATEVRLDIYPDGGMARLRLWGTLTDAGRADLARRWQQTT